MHPNPVVEMCAKVCEAMNDGVPIVDGPASYAAAFADGYEMAIDTAAAAIRALPEKAGEAVAWPHGAHTTQAAGKAIRADSGREINTPGLRLYAYVYEARWAGINSKELCPRWVDLPEIERNGGESLALEIGGNAAPAALPEGEVVEAARFWTLSANAVKPDSPERRKAFELFANEILRLAAAQGEGK